MYVEEIGIIRAKESDLLKFSDYERLVNMVSFKDLYTELVRLQIGYKEIPYEKIKSNISSIFSKNIINLYKEIISFLKETDENIKKAFLYEFDFFNLKLIFKNKFYDNKKFLDNLIDLGYLGKNNIKNFFEKDTLLFFNEKYFDWNEIFNIIRDFNTNYSPFDFDIFLDEVLTNFRIKISNNNIFLQEIFKRQIDFININLFLKDSPKYLKFGYIEPQIFKNLKNYNYEEKINIFREYNYEKIANIIFIENKKIDFLDLELKKEKFFLKISEKSIFYNFSIEPIIGYLIKKLCEIRTINRLLFIKTFLGNNLEKELKIIQNHKK